MRGSRSAKGQEFEIMKKFLKRLSGFILKLILIVLFFTVGLVLTYKYVNPPFTPLMIMRYFEHGARNAGIQKEWKNYESISANMKLAVVAAEDQKFATHRGFDLESIQDAIEDSMDGGELRGASTISQQTAKNVFLWPGRSWMRKGTEAYFTFLIEAIWGKRRILEVYLNVIETGEGIYGVEKASEIYFGKSVKNLSAEDSALIAAVLPNPMLWSPAEPSEYINRRKMWITRQMKNLGGDAYLNMIE